MASLAILTSYMHQRGGDLTSAITFMKALLAKDPTITFDWIVKRDISSYQMDLQVFKNRELGALSRSVNLTVLDSSDYETVLFDSGRVIDKLTRREITPDELTRRSDANWGLMPTWHGWKDVHEQLIAMRQTFSDAKATVVVANPHRLIQKDYELLHRLGHRIYLVPEYGLVHRNSKTYFPGDKLLETGFSSEELGVYIDDTMSRPDGFEAVMGTADEPFIEYLLSGYPYGKDQYHTHQALFYGYVFEKISLMSSSSPVNISTFIQNAIMIAMDCGDKKSIDIVIPGVSSQQLEIQYQHALSQLLPKYHTKITSAVYHTKTTSGEWKETHLFSSMHVGYRVRLINPHRLQRSTIQALLNEADAFVSLTGDASFVEGLIKGKLVCYQIMGHKKHAFDGFLSFLGTKFSVNSPLRQFYEVQCRTGMSAVQQWSEMRRLYCDHKAQMLSEAQQLSQYIKNEKNLNNTLTLHFLPLLSDKAPEPVMLPSSGVQDDANPKMPLPEISEKQQSFNALLDDLRQKKQTLINHGYHRAVRYAEDLECSLTKVSSNYFAKENPSANDFDDFKKGCDAAVALACHRLERYRGWKTFFVNLGLFLLGVAVGYGIAITVNYVRTSGKHVFFSVETGATQTLGEFKNDVSNKLPSLGPNKKLIP